MKCHRLWVQYSFDEMKYLLNIFIFFALRPLNTQCLQNSAEKEKWNRNNVLTLGSLCLPFHAGYRVRLKKNFNKNLQIFLDQARTKRLNTRFPGSPSPPCPAICGTQPKLKKETNLSSSGNYILLHISSDSNATV